MTTGQQQPVQAEQPVLASGPVTAVAEQPATDHYGAEYAALWQNVRAQETFDNWQKLVQFIMKSDDMHKIRDVLDEFLSKYPLCFGYWHQYATAEDKHGDRAKEIYEQGIQSTPYSIDLWNYYIDWLKEQEDTTPDAVRILFGRALQYVGIDWNAHRVFDKWIKYETDHGTPAQIAHVYTQAVATVTEEHKRLNTAFLEFAVTHEASNLMSEEEYVIMTIKAKRVKQEAERAAAAPLDGDSEMADAPVTPAAGEENPAGDFTEPTDAELEAIEVADEDIKTVWLKGHNEVYLNACKGWEKMHPFESRIRRRWWHQNPLQAPQILAWWQYLDSVAADDDETALYALHERCLVPCASYPEFWCRYFAFLHKAKMPDAPVILDYAIQRATRVFCRPRPEVHLCAAAVLDCRAFSSDLTAEQRELATAAAREALRTASTEVAPRALDVVSRYANFERRLGNTDFSRSLLRGLLDAAIQAGDPAAVEELAEANISFEDAVRRTAHAAAQTGMTDGEPVAEAAVEAVEVPEVAPVAGADAAAVAASGNEGEAQPMEAAETDPAAANAAVDASGEGNENANGSNAGVNEGKENSARNGEAGDGEGHPGDKTVAGDVAEDPNGTSAASAGTLVPSDADQSLLETALHNFPAREGLWTQAVAEKENLLPWGPERAQAVLEIYRRAITSTEPTEKEVSSTPGVDGAVAAAGAGTETSTKPALSLRVREKFAAAALSAMDFFGTPDQIWEAMELVLGLLGETLQCNAGSKRPAASQWQSTAQPDAKHHAAAPAGAGPAVSNVSHMHAAHAAHVHDPNAMAMYAQHDPNGAVAAAAAVAAQQHQYYGYDYSQYGAYYQQQAAAQGAAYPHAAVGSDYTAYYQQQYGAYQTQQAQ